MLSRHVSCVIAASPQRVYELASDPDVLPKWAAGLATAEIRRDGVDLWVASPMGEVRVRFAPKNSFGILDHDVTLPSEVTVTNPVRVIAHPDGAEVVFTIRQLDLTSEQFDRDCQTVASDLQSLKGLVEGGPGQAL